MKVLVALFLLLASAQSSMAKPMLRPREEDAYHLPIIVLAEYLGERKYFNPYILVANYRLLETLRGPSLPDTLDVLFEFDDGSRCIWPQNFDYKGHLPPSGEKQVLFMHRIEARYPLSSAPESVYTTYRGSFGRWKGSKENLAKVRAHISRADSD